VGTQYRSGIYTHGPEQVAVAQAVLDELQRESRVPVVTELMPEQNYTRAEDYHQHYFENHPGQGYCAMVVAPKVEKFKRSFAARFRA
jgi:peptide-methionine (S)-S-oxide reductase